MSTVHIAPSFRKALMLKPLKCTTFSTTTASQFKHRQFQHNKTSLSPMSSTYISPPCIPRGGSILLLTDDQTEDATCLVCYVRLIEPFFSFSFNNFFNSVNNLFFVLEHKHERKSVEPYADSVLLGGHSGVIALKKL